MTAADHPALALLRDTLGLARDVPDPDSITKLAAHAIDVDHVLVARTDLDALGAALATARETLSTGDPDAFESLEDLARASERVLDPTGGADV